MPLHIAQNQAELDQLSEALKGVGERQPSASGTLTFYRYSDQAKQLSKGLSFASLNDPAEGLAFAERCDQLSGVCDALADHVMSPEGRLFWQDKKALLLGLADHFHHLSSKARNRASQDLLNLA